MSDDKDVKDALADPGHLFDQTNGMADGLAGDSDGTAASDEESAADRGEEDAPGGLVTARDDDRE